MQTNEYIKFQDYLKRLRTNYYNALCAFYVYEEIEESRASNIIGEKESHDNIKIMNLFKNFFVITRHSLNFYFLMELAKLLDDAKQSLHLNKLINFANSNKNILDIDHFKKTNANREFLQELVKRYDGIQKKDLERINKKLQDTESIRKKIIDYRNQYLAHEDIKKKKISITQIEIVKMFNVIAEILNIFSYKTDFSTTSYSHVEDGCKKETKDILECLKIFEKNRLKEIERKYKI